MNLKQVKIIRKAYVAYQRFMCAFLTDIAPVTATKYVYKYNTGKRLPLNDPVTFNEKLQWLKLFGDQDLMIRCADKYAVRSHVQDRDCGRTLNTLYGVYDKVADIDFDALPDSFVLKTTNGCGTNIICRNKSQLDVEKTKKQLNYWMKHPYGRQTAETHYLKIKPRIICEKIIETEGGTLPFDYKFFCFNGEPRFFYLGYDRENGFKKVHYNLQWNIIDITKEQGAIPVGDLKPACFDDMVECARKIAAGIPFVRVDFYDSKGSAVFGEMTFTPTAGMSEIYTEEAAKWMGGMIALPARGE